MELCPILPAMLKRYDAPRPQLYVAFLLLCVMFSPPAAAEGQSFGGPLDIARAEATWTELEAARLVGEQAITTPLLVAREPVGRLIEVLGAAIEVLGVPRRAFVKRLYADVDEAQIDADRGRHLIHSVVMVQAERGYNPQGDDWFFVRYGPAGAILPGPDGRLDAGRLHMDSDIGCMACHRAAPGGDFVFTTDDVR